MDQPPCFKIPLEVMQPYYKSTSSGLLKRTLDVLRGLGPQLDDAAMILELIDGVAQSFARQASHVADDSDHDDYSIYCVTRARAAYLLLQVYRPDPDMVLSEAAPRTTVIGETIRLAALLFLLRLAGFSSGTVSHHTDRLVDLLECHDWDWPELTELRLWALALAAVMLQDSAPREQSLVRRMNGLLRQLKVPWDELSAILQDLVWVPKLLDDRLSELQKACGNSDD